MFRPRELSINGKTQSESPTDNLITVYCHLSIDLALKVAGKKKDQRWQRTLYVDDLTNLLSFCLNITQFVFNGTCYQQVLARHLNSVGPSILFTFEGENETSFPSRFKCLKNEPGKSGKSVYRKPNTDREISRLWLSPRCIFAECLPDSKEKERQYVLSLSKDDGYPKTFHRNCFKPVTSLRDTSVDEISTPVHSWHYSWK